MKLNIEKLPQSLALIFSPIPKETIYIKSWSLNNSRLAQENDLERMPKDIHKITLDSFFDVYSNPQVEALDKIL